MSINIGKKVIEKNGAPFIIAEAGINHNGDLDLAKKMVLVAKNAECDAIKFQTFKAEEFCSDPTILFTYKSQGSEVTESMLEMFKKHEFTKKQWAELKKLCDDENIIFMSTPQNISDLDMLIDIGVEAIKVGSDDFTNIPLIKNYNSRGLPLILSCGMADLAEIYTTLNAINAIEDTNRNIVLCLCTSQYPTPPEDINLRKLITLEHAFPHVIKGFSDHSVGPLASSLAVTYGAAVFEKHFTLDNNLPGPDHWFSENPSTLKNWVKNIRTAYKMLGSPLISPTKKEIEMRSLARRSVVALQNINQGDKLTESNIGLRRPGDGLPPIFIDEIIGKIAKNDINKHAKISLGDFYDR